MTDSVCHVFVFIMFRCKVVLDSLSGYFYTNSEINGLFKCFFKRDIKIRTVKIRLDCFETVEWTSFQCVTPCIKQADYNIIYTSEQTIFTARKGDKPFRKEICYPFKIFIPKGLPSSFEDHYGKVLYVVTGTVNPFIWNDFEDSFVIKIKSPLEVYRTSRFIGNEKVYSNRPSKNHYFYGNHEKIKMHVYLPRNEFIPGDIVDFQVVIKNASKQKVRLLKIKLTKRTTFRTLHPTEKLIRKSETILKQTQRGVKAHTEKVYDLKLFFPENLYVANLTSCQLIKIIYDLKISCKVCWSFKKCTVHIFPEMGHIIAGMTEDKSQFVLPLDQPIVSLEVSSAFKGLTDKEKLYAHYISAASWTGSLITFLQTSPESGPIFVLLHKLFSLHSPEKFKADALQAGFTEDEIKALFIYACGVFCNAGNYKGFGDSKFIPNIDSERLESMLETSHAWPNIKSLWFKLKEHIYDLSAGKTCLGYAPNGLTTYLSQNCLPEDNQRVQDWMKSQALDCFNTRLFKTVDKDGKIDYEIRLASEEKGEIKQETIGNITYHLTKGDYSPIIGKVAQYLEKASNYAANSTQTNMLKSYAQSFITGSIADHKQGSRYWIQDKGPAVETYIGFIETYRDPAGVRGEFEGFVAIVNRAMSAKFANLVAQAEEFLPLLPWSKGFEKDKFLRPDFTSLDVLTFASSGIPAGINIPNYDEIRQTEGFKNVSLGNVIPASYQMAVTPFLSKADAELIQKWRVASFELQVGLHELLGHGSGKLLYRNADRTLNYPSTLLDPFTGKPPATCYEQGDTYDTRFGPLSSSYEECRAEAVGLYLSLEPAILKIFGHEGQEAEDVLYVNWLSLVWNGIGKALETWDPKRGWLQAHAQARFVLARVLIQAGVASVSQPSDGDLLVTLDRSALRGAGRCAIGNFLLQLQVYKATANVEAAQQLYHHYSEVTEPWLGWRSIVLANKQPRKMFTQANTVLKDEKVELKTYEESPEGLIQSWVDRFSKPEELYDAVLELSAADEHHFG